MSKNVKHLVDKVVYSSKEYLDDRDIVSLYWMAENLAEAGWADGDIVIMIMCREEVNPTLSEEDATLIRSILQDSYKKN